MRATKRLVSKKNFYSFGAKNPMIFCFHVLFITRNRVHKLAPKCGVEPHSTVYQSARSIVCVHGIIKKNRVRKLDAALRIELSLQAYETRQTTKPSQPRFNCSLCFRRPKLYQAFAAGQLKMYTKNVIH